MSRRWCTLVPPPHVIHLAVLEGELEASLADNAPRTCGLGWARRLSDPGKEVDASEARVRTGTLMHPRRATKQLPPGRHVRVRHELAEHGVGRRHRHERKKRGRRIGGRLARIVLPRALRAKGSSGPLFASSDH